MTVFYLLNTITHIGGISTISLQKINYLILTQKYNVIVFVKYHPIEYEEYHNGKLKIFKSEHHYLNRSVFNKLLYAINLFKKLTYLKKLFKPNIVISTLSSIDFFTLPIAFRKTPLILEIHATSNLIIQWSHPFKIPIYKLYSKVIFLNEIEKSIFKLPNSIVIPNFISDNLKTNHSHKKKIIISGGRNDVIKQWHHQIEAWNTIFHELLDWEFHIYIDAELHEIENYKSNIHENCKTLKIFKASEKFKQHLSEASILVLSSKVECFPMNILEAFSFGTVVVSYATISGPISLIKNKSNGILVEQDNINDLAEAILSTAKNSQLRVKLSQSAKTLLSSSYSEKKVMKRWISLFNSL